MINTPSLVEKTQNMLLNGSIIASKSDNNNSKMTIYGKGKKVVGPAFSKKAASNKCTTCGNVTLGAPLLACDFCEKRTCSSCVRVCNGCEKFFCHVCSVIKYVYLILQCPFIIGKLPWV